MPDSDAIYVKQLSTVLRTRDVDGLRAFLREEAAVRDPDRAAEIDRISDEDLETRMYKMILARPDLADLHADARRWLNDRGIEVRFG